MPEDEDKKEDTGFAEEDEDDVIQQIERQNTDDGEQYTLRQLVWTITGESARDVQQLTDVLLLCHGVFAESTELLELLMERFRGKTTLSGAPLKCNHHSDDEEERKTQWNRQVKVGSMLSAWMKTFWEQDFDSSDALLDSLDAFFDGVEHEFAGNRNVQVLLKVRYSVRTTRHFGESDIWFNTVARRGQRG